MAEAQELGLETARNLYQIPEEIDVKRHKYHRVGEGLFFKGVSGSFGRSGAVHYDLRKREFPLSFTHEVMQEGSVS